MAVDRLPPQDPMISRDIPVPALPPTETLPSQEPSRTFHPPLDANGQVMQDLVGVVFVADPPLPVRIQDLPPIRYGEPRDFRPTKVIPSRPNEKPGFRQ